VSTDGRQDPRPVSEAASASEALVLTGRVEESSFADLMKSLVRSRETALLTLSREKITKAVYVLEGRLIFATSTDPDERLGESLLREGTITIEQYEESGRLIRPGKRQGTILVELGYVTPNELVKGVKTQVESIVLNLFRWRSGDYRIEIRELDTRDIITLNISTENLIFSGIKQGAGWSQVMRGLTGSLETVLDRAPDADTRLYKLDLSDDEAHVYSLANGRLSVAQIVAMSFMSNYATCVTLWGLASCGILNVVSSKDAESLFREQVAEFELIEIRDLVEGFNRALRMACDRVAPVAGGDRLARMLDGALAEVIDAHYDVLHDAALTGREIDPDLLVENVAVLESGRRRALVEAALDELLVALLLAVRRQVSPDLESDIAREARRLRGR
jgi:hypothetical protein